MMLLRAYAKINLGLRVLRKREDGYHDIETIFHRINLYDEVKLTARNSGILFSSENTDIPSDSGNLCVQSALLFQQYTNISKGVDIHLHKMIPVGAGLGGGSSDAATVLLALSELWNAPVPFLQLREMAHSLGSDVPYFLLDGTAYATGRGEALEYFPFELPYWVVTVFPNQHILTKWAYQHVTPDGSRTMPLKEILLDGLNNMDYLRENLGNDFEKPVFEQFPLIKELKKEFYMSGAQYVSLSGSGSSMFGLYTNEREAKAFQERTLHITQLPAFITPPNFSAFNN